jgi:NAD(P)-dependent dehydrogenase (short-subunit alcohol dehydrogenase family)
MVRTVTVPDRVVVVNGGSRGIGRAIAKAFLTDGATVVTTSRNECESWEPRHRHITCDQRDDEAVRQAVGSIRDDLGRVDVLVNNAGGSPKADFATASPRFVESVIALNLVGPLLFSRAVNEVMQTQDGGGVIVNISSMAGTEPSPGWIAYGAAKAGLDHATRSLALEWAPRVRLVSLALGSVLTDRVREAYEDLAPGNAMRASLSTSALGRPATMDEVTSLCVFVASTRCTYLSGVVLPVHGAGAPTAMFPA